MPLSTSDRATLPPALTYPDTGFADLFRACRVLGYHATQHVGSAIIRLLEPVRERVKTRDRHEEFVVDRAQAECGIGVVYV